MLLPALLTLSMLQQRGTVPYSLIQKTEAKSPHLEQATLIQNKRKAYESLLLVKDPTTRPGSILKTNWRKSNIVIVYPGLVQKDSKIILRGLKRVGKAIQVTVEWHRGISAEAYYPMYYLKIPKQREGTEIRVYDPNQLHTSYQPKHHAEDLNRARAAYSLPSPASQPSYRNSPCL